VIGLVLSSGSHRVGTFSFYLKTETASIGIVMGICCI